MTNAVQNQPATLGLETQKEINDFLVGTSEVMKSLSKYKKKDLDDGLYDYDDVTDTYNWGEDFQFPEEGKWVSFPKTYQSRFHGIGQLPNAVEWWVIDAKDFIQNRSGVLQMRFPLKKLKTDFWRKKMSLWIAQEWFSETYDRRSVEQFLSSNECVYQDIQRWICWDD